MQMSCACSSSQRSCRCGHAASQQSLVPLPAAIALLLQAKALPALLPQLLHPGQAQRMCP